MVKAGILHMLAPQVREKYNAFEKPVIGMHIRRGDFKRGSIITPLNYFTEVAKKLRADAGTDLPVTIFTDADNEELSELTALTNVRIAEPKPDILDLLLLADSRFVVLSIGSTFSYWAAFLSEGVIIKNEGEWHVPFRAATDKNYVSEMVWKNAK